MQDGPGRHVAQPDVVLAQLPFCRERYRVLSCAKSLYSPLDVGLALGMRIANAGQVAGLPRLVEGVAVSADEVACNLIWVKRPVAVCRCPGDEEGRALVAHPVYDSLSGHALRPVSLTSDSVSSILGRMENVKDIRTGRHVVYELHAHLVFVTKYRKLVLGDEMLSSMEGYMAKVCEDFGCSLDEFNGESDHVHLLVSFPPQVALSRLVNSLKGVSSRLLRRDYPDEVRTLPGALWSPSYYAGSAGGVTLDVLEAYVKSQNHPR